MSENEGNTPELRKWMNEITSAERDHSTYLKRAKAVVKRYRDEDRGDSDNLPARYNILWSNTETMGPALYSRTPAVQVDRRFKDSDPVGRAACQIWERATQFSIDNYDFDGLMLAVIKDYQLAGRGTAWMRYEPLVEGDQIQYQSVMADHVHYTDFLHSPGKQWRSVRWVARKIYLRRRQLIDRFGDKIGKEIPLDYNNKEVTSGSDDAQSGHDKEAKQACIYEIWDSDTMRVRWISKSYKDGLLDQIEDPLGLHNFFPTPKPLFGTTTTETLIPIPDYCQYQDQAIELDMVTMKICLLEDALRLVGVYDASFQNLGQILQNTKQNELIPINNFPAFTAKGGFEGVMQWMSLADIVGALQALYLARQQIKSDLYEITGISDIIRGATSPTGTTATEQQMKGQFATLRISDRQRDVQRYAEDLIGMHGEIIAEHFEPQTIAMMSATNVTQPDVQQQFMEAVTLLKSDPMRSFRISIESDSMVAIDEAVDKQKGTEFLQAVGSFLEGGMKAAQAAPIVAPFIAEGLLYITRRFNAGRSMEAVIEQMGQGLTQMAQQAMSQPKQDPEAMKAQAKIQLEQQDSQNKLQLSQQEIQQRAQLSQVEMQQRMQLEQQKAEQQLIIKQKEAEQDAQLAREKMMMEMAMQQEKHQHEMQMEREKLANDHTLESKKAVLSAGIEGLHVLDDGRLTTKPRTVKEAEFYTDPISGNRKARITETTDDEDD
jgi:hypothetical protein